MASSKGKKRKLVETTMEIIDGSKNSIKRSKIDASSAANIAQMEKQILESRRHYNNIAALLKTLQSSRTQGSLQIVASISLCRVFCRFMVTGEFAKPYRESDSESLIALWIRERYADYSRKLLRLIRSGEPEAQTSILPLVMRLMAAESEYLNSRRDYKLSTSLFSELVRAVIEAEHGDELRAEFLKSYVEPYDDIRYYTFGVISELASEEREVSVASRLCGNILSILGNIERIPTTKQDLEEFFVDAPKSTKHALFSLKAHKKHAQGAWLATMSMGLTKAQRKTVLGILPHQIAPWFLKPELLMDFLTDSYDTGGAVSLLSLSGIFYLIQEKNLDYPLFYAKLYSLLDFDILHSKHRSRFMRLLDTFLDSSHLPIALVASFIKRISRLSLHAPPSGIVAIIPWIYNLLKKHPACTFMVHREQSKEFSETLRREGMEDPFDMNETDPMTTNAIDSSLWEIEMLQSHYHPNVASLAKIISEQFTKQTYKVEDFLDHSYASMLAAEFSREIKKPPVVEFEIPKTIFRIGESETDPKLLLKLWDFR